MGERSELGPVGRGGFGHAEEGVGQGVGVRGRQSLWRKQREQTHTGSEFGKQMQNRKQHHLALTMKPAQGRMWLDEMDEGPRMGA